MDRDNRYIIKIEGGISSDGKAFMMEFTTRDGEQHRFFSNLDMWDGLLAFLISVSQEAMSKLSEKDREQLLSMTEKTTYPINAVSARVAHGRSDEEIMLSVHVGASMLTFALPAEQGTALCKDALEHASNRQGPRRQ